MKGPPMGVWKMILDLTVSFLQYLLYIRQIYILCMLLIYTCFLVSSTCKPKCKSTYSFLMSKILYFLQYEEPAQLISMVCFVSGCRFHTCHRSFYVTNMEKNGDKLLFYLFVSTKMDIQFLDNGPMIKYLFFSGSEHTKYIIINSCGYGPLNKRCVNVMYKHVLYKIFNIFLTYILL